MKLTISILNMLLGISGKFEITASFFRKNDEKTTLKPYMISQQIYLKKMIYVPEFVALYEIVPFIILELDNESIRVVVKDYLEDGELRDAIIKKYGLSLIHI